MDAKKGNGGGGGEGLWRRILFSVNSIHVAVVLITFCSRAIVPNYTC